MLDEKRPVRSTPRDPRFPFTFVMKEVQPSHHVIDSQQFRTKKKSLSATNCGWWDGTCCGKWKGKGGGNWVGYSHILVGGCKHFLVSPLLGEDFHFA